MEIKVMYKNLDKEHIFHFFVGKETGKGKIIKLDYHKPAGDGDAHYVDVEFEKGGKERIFKPDAIEFYDNERKEVTSCD